MKNQRTDAADAFYRNSPRVRMRARLMGTTDIQRQLRQSEPDGEH